MDVQENKEDEALSDYGSDFSPEEELLLNDLLLGIASPIQKDQAPAPRDIEDVELRDTHLPRQIRALRKAQFQWPANTDTQGMAEAEISSNSNTESIIGSAHISSYHSRQTSSEQSKPGTNITGSGDPDIRTPLERFRTKPKKPLSVTDLISPSWCEMQYWYSLTKHGRVRQTPAMRQGSAVHKTLEEQVHTTVVIDLTTREDAWALKFWNVIQGLRTLRETGMTRELEIWGVIDGQVVNGVIDELSYTCPDTEMEQKASSTVPREGKNTTLPGADQTQITTFFETTGDNEQGQTLSDYFRHLSENGPKEAADDSRKVYLTDVKTRGAASIPKGAAFRPTAMQLMIYHWLLSDLAANRVDPRIILNRYNLDGHAAFSDGLIAQICHLDDPFAGGSSLQTLLDNNSLHQLWLIMALEFHITMPAGARSMGNVLKAEYRHSGDGEILGVRTFLYEHDVVTKYVRDELRWWKGEREVQGVSVEEAYKCRMCEFADTCTWRKSKIEEATQAYRSRSRSII
ncbi:MAG: hypothetical protein MMC33_010577 [Icmadophila ericetorum]|nr:hypothetical protein [Icmadophila ericetorum]